MDIRRLEFKKKTVIMFPNGAKKVFLGYFKEGVSALQLMNFTAKKEQPLLFFSDAYCGNGMSANAPMTVLLTTDTFTYYPPKPSSRGFRNFMFKSKYKHKEILAEYEHAMVLNNEDGLKLIYVGRLYKNILPEELHSMHKNLKNPLIYQCDARTEDSSFGDKPLTVLSVERVEKASEYHSSEVMYEVAKRVYL